MKKTLRVLCLTLLTMVCLMSFAAAAVESGNCGDNEDNLTWVLDTETGVLTISGEGGMPNWYMETTPFGGRVSITEVVVEEGVTNIGRYAFVDCAQLQKVTLPESLEAIRWGAFEGCSGLMEIDLPGNLTTIDGNAFAMCSLVELEIPASVTEIGDGAFLKGVTDRFTVEEGNDCFRTDERGVLMTADGGKILAAPSALTGEYAVPEGVKSIGKQAFYQCRGITTMTLPASVEELGWLCLDASASEGFAVAADSKNFKAEDGVLFTADGTLLVMAPRNLAGEYTVPHGVKTVGEAAFAECWELTAVTLPEGVEVISARAFPASPELTRVTLPSTIVEVKEFAFDSEISSLEVWYPGSVEDLQERAAISFGNEGLLNAQFYVVEEEGGSELATSGVCGENMTWSMDAESGVLTISGQGEMWDWDTFADHYAPWEEYWDKIHSVTVGEGVTGIGNCAFAFYENIEEVKLPESLERIGEYAFCGTALEEVSIPAGVMEIDPCAFVASVSREFIVEEGNPCYKSVDGVLFSADGAQLINYPRARDVGGLYPVPEGTEVIRESAFLDAQLKAIALYDGVTGIFTEAFANSTIEEIIIPVTVESIGGSAFRGCENLHTVYYDGSEAQWNEIAIEAEGNEPLLNATIDFRIKDEPEYLDGDINCDGYVNARDVNALRRDFGKKGDEIGNKRADINGDGYVNARDVNALRRNFGKSSL